MKLIKVLLITIFIVGQLIIADLIFPTVKADGIIKQTIKLKSSSVEPKASGRATIYYKEFQAQNLGNLFL